eukprot:9346748-Heterocapsa_arctica.AAC.1
MRVRAKPRSVSVACPALRAPTRRQRVPWRATGWEEVVSGGAENWEPGATVKVFPGVPDSTPAAKAAEEASKETPGTTSGASDSSGALGGLGASTATRRQASATIA